ncbi:HtaA domain-containing protein [Corynebacterium striatum]
MTSRRGTFLAALVTASLIPLAPPALAIPATDGHLTWGIRASFNNYTGGATLVKDGATRKGNAFEFELTNLTVDKAAKRTEAQFNGTVVYRKYCENASNPLEGHCDLDLHFEDPKVVLAPEESYLEATVSSRQYLSGTTFAPEKPVKIAKLQPQSATLREANGRVDWSNIASTLTPEGNTMFSKFYTDGEGLDPVSLSYAGEAAPLNTSGPTLSTAQWDSKAKYDDGVHQLFEAGQNIIVSMPNGHGFALLNSELKELASRPAATTDRNIVTFDSQHSVLYYGEGYDLKAVDVSADSLSEPRTVFTASQPIYAVGYHPATDTVAAVATGKDNSFTSAALVTGTQGSFHEAELPDAAQLFGDTPASGGSGAWGDIINAKDNAELVPMEDGTFLYNGAVDIMLDNEDKSAKGLLYSIKPSATEVGDRAKFMKGSRHGDNTLYMKSLVSDGSTIYRFDKNPFPASAVAQILRYDAAQRDVVAVTKPTRSVLPGWASLAFDAEGTPIQQNGATGDLNWLKPGTFETTASFTLPNGRETTNVANGSFIARKDGAIFVPTLDESRGDYEEYYVLRRVDTAAKEPAPQPVPPTESSPQPTPPTESSPQPTPPAESSPQPTPPTESSPQPTPPEKPKKPSPSSSAGTPLAVLLGLFAAIAVAVGAIKPLHSFLLQVQRTLGL